MWSYQRSVFDNLINEKKTKTTKGWNYKNLGNFLPFVLHCMLAFCRVLQNIWRRYWIKTSLTSFHWQKTHVLVVPKLYQEKGEVGLTTSCSCMSLRAVLLVNQFDVVCSPFLLLLLLHSNSSTWMTEKLYISMDVNLKSKIVGCLNPFILKVLVFCSKYEPCPRSASQVKTEEPDVVSSANRASASRHLRSAGWQVVISFILFCLNTFHSCGYCI